LLNNDIFVVMHAPFWRGSEIHRVTILQLTLMRVLVTMVRLECYIVIEW